MELIPLFLCNFLLRKQVASIDGQLIYTTNTMGNDVLMYFKPGEKPQQMHFPEACQRLKDAHSKLGEWMSTLVETEVSRPTKTKSIPTMCRSVSKIILNFSTKTRMQHLQMSLLQMILKRNCSNTRKILNRKSKIESIKWKFCVNEWMNHTTWQTFKTTLKV